jgi:LmbE family N-acetylglucosaminyl deacetylase
MVFAPHPDDEALACAGIIHSALQRGDKVCVVLVTCGDAYLSARDRLVKDYPGRAFDRDGDGDFDMLDYGVLRHEETLSAMDALGLDPSDVVFLGYPDAGIDDLWRSPETYTSPHTGVSEVPASFGFARSVGNPYNRDSILSDVMGVIREFRPTLLFSPRDSDHHQDHWATGRFVSQALTELREFQTWKAHYGYLVHWESNESGWPHDQAEWSNPKGHAPWDWQVPLSETSFTPAMKELVINRYFSQLLGGGTYLQNFAKNSEIFWLEGFGNTEF